jgi:hypothetical protein
VSTVAFLVPFVGVSVLDLQHDLYYLVYFITAAAVLVVYVRVEGVDVRRIVTHAWRWSLALGVVAGLAVAGTVLGEVATDRPSGPYFVLGRTSCLSFSGAASLTGRWTRCC